jgi:hypothetical protein
MERIASNFQTARALIGWMDESIAAQLLKPIGDLVPSPATLGRVRAARAAVAGRSRQSDPPPELVVRDLPNELSDHVAHLRERPAAKAYFGPGWSLGIVDLRSVHPLLPTVLTDGGRERVRSVSPNDIRSVAAITLPSEVRKTVMAPGFDPAKNAWTVSSANPNLRVVGQTAGPIQDNPGLLGIGFVVAEMESFMQVGLYQNRWFLRDGHHRATSLLQAGIQFAPAFIQRFERPEELVIANGLPLGAVLGVDPPRMGDFFDESVSAEVRTPAARKVIVVQALELSVLELGLPQSATTDET